MERLLSAFMNPYGISKYVPGFAAALGLLGRAWPRRAFDVTLLAHCRGTRP